MAPSLIAAFTAGILSFLSPCVLPLVPAYLAVLAGGRDKAGSRSAAILRAGLFILGFTLVFVLLGLGASAVGQALRSSRYVITRFGGVFPITRLGGVLLILLGLHQTGLLRLVPLYRERRLAMPRGGTAFAAFLIGIVFALGWTPCVGPVLAAILTLAGTTGRLSQGAVLLVAYSAGLGLPFLAVALGYESLRSQLGWLGRFTPYFEAASGILLILLGLLLVFGRLDFLQRMLG